jgi:hypothetical protein
MFFLGLALLATSAALLAGAWQTRPDLGESRALLGASTEHLVAQGYTCRSGINATANRYCTLLPQTGSIAHVGVLIAHNRAVRINLTARGEQVQLGDLVAAWGEPGTEKLTHKHTVQFGWDGVQALGFGGDDSSGYFLPIQTITLTPQEAGQPIGSRRV